MASGAVPLLEDVQGAASPGNSAVVLFSRKAGAEVTRGRINGPAFPFTGARTAVPGNGPGRPEQRP